MRTAPAFNGLDRAYQTFRRTSDSVFVSPVAENVATVASNALALAIAACEVVESFDIDPQALAKAEGVDYSAVLSAILERRRK